MKKEVNVSWYQVCNSVDIVVYLYRLTQLSAWEDFIEFCRRETFKTHSSNCVLI